MNDVDPIRNKQDIKNFYRYLRNKGNTPEWIRERNYLIARIQFNLAYRYSDLARLQVKHLLDKDRIKIVSQKQNKVIELPINSKLRKEIREYYEKYCEDDDDFIARSKKGYNKPITRQQLYHIYKEAGEAIGLIHKSLKIGTHTPRKSFGYHHYQKNKDAVLLMYVYKHSHISVVLRYIGIIQDDIDNSLDGFDL